MELKHLKGKMMLDAVDFDRESIKSWGDHFEDCDVCRLRLNGNIFSAVEDPDDGYRSSMRELAVGGDTPMKNVFQPVEVLCRYRDKGEYNEVDDILELIDTTTGKTILEVGTRNTDDYYPYYVANFSPENMALNVDA